jgi:maltose O-acetyltransferase
MKFITKLFKTYFCLFFLKVLPLFSFPLLNSKLFRLMGYNIDKTVIIFSSARIIGDISVKIGANTFIGHETLIMGGDSTISIGSDCDISSRVNIISGTHKIDMNGTRSAGNGLGKDIIIEDGVWIGFGVIILPGVKIGRKSIIGAGSVVVNDIPPYSIAVGNPCKVVRTWDKNNKKWK